MRNTKTMLISSVSDNNIDRAKPDDFIAHVMCVADSNSNLYVAEHSRCASKFCFESSRVR